MKRESKYFIERERERKRLSERERVKISQKEREREREREGGEGVCECEKEREQYKSVVFACKESSGVKKEERHVSEKKLNYQVLVMHKSNIRRNAGLKNQSYKKHFGTFSITL